MEFLNFADFFFVCFNPSAFSLNIKMKTYVLWSELKDIIQMNVKIVATEQAPARQLCARV